MSSVPDHVNPGLVEAARELIESLGVKIVLLHGVEPDGSCSCGKLKCASAGKHPRDAGWKEQATRDLGTVEQWVNQHPHLNLGWVPGNRYIVVDIDPRNGGLDSYQRMRNQLPPTRTHTTGGQAVDGFRGRHAIYQRPDGVKINQTGKIAKGVDFKTGNGSLLVAPGSRTQGPYLVTHSEVGVAELPSTVINIITGFTGPGTTPAAGPRHRFGEPIVAGERETELIKYAGDLASRLHRGVISQGEAEELMALRWQDTESIQGDNVSREKALGMLRRMVDKDVVRDIQPTEPVEDPVLADGYWGNDIGNSQRLLEHARGHVKWVDSWSSWVVYRNGVWRIDANRVLMLELARETVVVIRTAASLLPKQPRETLWKWANTSSAVKNLEAMVKMARGAQEVFADHHELNTHAHLLNVLNGTIDLLTNDILPHSPAHLLTTQAPVEYDPEAQCPTWEDCVARWQPDPATRWFLQKAVGSGLIGHAVQHLFINWGSGGNGKGVFYNTIGDILGDDYYTVPHQSLITVQKHTQHDTVKASLYGSRMAVAAETAESAKLNEALVKELTGGDMLRARRMRENEWNFRPTHTMFLHTNHKPQIKGGDEGIWRRIYLIPWEVTIPERERDDQFKERLLRERSGILNWLLQGCAGYLLEKFTNPPEKVVAATSQYRYESDLMGRFLAERGVVIDSEGWTATSELQLQYQLWCAQEGVKMPPLWKVVVHRLEQMGAEPAMRKLEGRTTRGFAGISCIPKVIS